jgi:hypothetical protein
MGTRLVFSDDEGVDLCSLTTFSIPPGATVYVHVTEFGDNGTAPLYFVQINFP